MNKKQYERIKEYCSQYQLLEPEDGVVVGLSGGADSVCLLHFLVELRKEWGLKLCAVHINHGIRGQAALADETASADLAAAWSVDFRSFSEDIPQRARMQGCSVEEAGRLYRYECFEQVRRELGYDKIAVAHHRDDQAETMLWQMLRGSGFRGMGGIRPRRDCIIRPLLLLGRQEIEDALQEEGITWCEDESNFEEEYTRNKLRNRVFPYIEKEIQPMARQHLAELSEECQMVWDYLARQTAARYEELVDEAPDGVLRISVVRLSAEDAVLQHQLILAMLERMAGSRKDLGRTHVEALLSLAQGETGKRLDLPYGIQAGLDYNWLWLRRSVDAAIETEREEPHAAVGESLCFTDSRGVDWRITWQKCLAEKLPAEVPQNDCTKWFDYDKINADVVGVPVEESEKTMMHSAGEMPTWRFPAEGDYLCLTPTGEKKKLARIFIDEKIPVGQREHILVLALGNHIIWVPELGRTSAAYYVTEHTKQVWVAQMERESLTKEKGGTA